MPINTYTIYNVVFDIFKSYNKQYNMYMIHINHTLSY